MIVEAKKKKGNVVIAPWFFIIVQLPRLVLVCPLCGWCPNAGSSGTQVGC